MVANFSFVGELVADRLPGLAAIIRPLDQLTEPAGRLREVDPVRVDRRSLEVVNVPARKVGPGDIPLLTPVIRRQDKRPLVRPDQNPNSAHASSSNSDPTASTILTSSDRSSAPKSSADDHPHVATWGWLLEGGR